MPKRIQLKRSKGWRKPDGAVVVARPSKWGNPFVIAADTPGDRAAAVENFRRWLRGENGLGIDPAKGLALAQSLHELRGKDLCCWCPLDKACHADVLLELANK